MIFWIILMIIGVALIGALCVSVIKTKKEREYIRLKAIYDEKDAKGDQVLYAGIRSVGSVEWNRIDNEYQQARKELRAFEAKHPSIENRAEDRATVRTVFLAIAVVAGIIALVMTLIIAIENIGAQEYRARLEMEGQMIQQALDAGDYEELIAVNGTADAFTAAKDYNVTIRGGQVGQNNFWYGIFVPDIYDGLEMVTIPQK